ncbi:dsDNA nuclease domain-containing protein [Bradyrhizobium sp. CCBAU 11357]|uniref:dsDNA nuclease domain-containing protein n=1 Tax=Bradyrhizobium sp. CCBAU 11357 TaxID=1630808 RepID=UPI002302C4A3|nr:dsDNA nuclease domain-containing protein [Bradyrhizobium sp. CCBAU 11357]MDA9499674.1 hypothetical protein [Bradyrhizobium sp. CCBAU 11357]
MRKSLLEALVEKPQRETSGSDTSARFDYQKGWAFCQMLRRHMEQADYLVAFEFHDDVLFLTPSAAPTSAEFFQVKTSSAASPRKLASLLLRPKKSNSILGKMFLNFDGLLSGNEVQVILVSNVAFEFAGKDISANELPKTVRTKIITKLKDEIQSFDVEKFEKLHFIVSGVSIEAMHSYLHGEAMELFNSQFGEGHGFNVHSWVRLIHSEIARKNNYASDKIATVDDLISKKCIGRKVVNESLELLSSQKRKAPDMTLVNIELKDAGWASQDLMRMGKRMPQAVTDFTDPTNLEAGELVNQLEELFSSQPDVANLSHFIGLAEQELRALLRAPYDLAYLRALSVVIYYEKI